MNRTNLFLCLMLTAPIAAAGCANPHATVELFHPAESGSQELVSLSSDWAKYGQPADGGLAHLILEWPLPGSRYGTKQYLLYARLPSGSGVFCVGDPILPGGEPSARIEGDTPPEAKPESDVVSGFLIQRTGRLKGVTHFVSGTIEVSSGTLQEGTLDLICSDQTEIRGDFIARPGFRATFFESKYEQDIGNAKSAAKGGQSPQPAAAQ